MKKYIILLSLLVFVFCGSKEKQIASHSHEQDGHEHEAQAPEVSEQEAHESEQEVHLHEGEDHPELHLSAKKQKEWGIVVGTATKQDIASKITIPGVLALNQNKTAHISSFVKGKVVSLSADLGDRVKKKQVLVTINSPDFAQAQATFLQARAKLNLSRQEVERARLLKPNMYIQEIVENRQTEKKILAIPEEAIQNMNGEKIVIKGAFNLKAELTKQSFGAAHVH